MSPVRTKQKESLVEIIDFLHNPQKYAAIGAKLPKGRAACRGSRHRQNAAGQGRGGRARVPFFSISGSDFVEMFVGVGASRVRAISSRRPAKVAPAIIFIDEIDAIGRSRDNRLGGNDKREQTLNQLLAEIDGFDSSKGVVILAATNRPEILDKALLRAGRFDHHIIVDRPNLEGRYQTLLVPRATSALPRTSTSRRSHRPRRAQSARILPTSSMRRRCAPCAWAARP